MAGFEALYVAGLLSVLYFLVVPAAAWVVSLLLGLRAWRILRSAPLSEPPVVHGGFVWRSYAMVTLEVLLLGVVLWILWSPTVQALQLGGAPSAIDPTFSLFTYTGQVFSETAWMVSLSQAMVFQSRARDLLGRGFPRVQALFAIPTLGGVMGLLVGYRAAFFAEGVLSTPTIQSTVPSLVVPASTGFLLFGLAVLAIPGATALALRQDLASRAGFARGLTASILGVVPSVVALLILWFWFLSG